MLRVNSIRYSARVCASARSVRLLVAMLNLRDDLETQLALPSLKIGYTSRHPFDRDRGGVVSTTQFQARGDRIKRCKRRTRKLYEILRGKL